MNRQDKINYIVDYYNSHFKWQKLVYGQQIDIDKVKALTDDELDAFITENCK